MKIRTPFALSALVLSMALMFSGCKTVSTPQPLAPGYNNSADQVMGETLAAAHSFYNTLQADTTSGKFSPSPTEVTALNTFALSLNAAQSVYLAYHAGTATQAEAQTAINSVATQQASLQSTLAQGVK